MILTGAALGAAYLAVGAATTAVDPTVGLGNYLAYGPLGLMVIGFLTGQIVPGRTAKRAEDENDRLRSLIETQVLPLVQKNTDVTEQAIAVLAELQHERPRRRAPG